MRIDWCKGTWRVWTLDGALLCEAQQISIRTPVELVNADNGHRGFLIVDGQLQQANGYAVILPIDRGE